MMMMAMMNVTMVMLIVNVFMMLYANACSFRGWHHCFCVFGLSLYMDDMFCFITWSFCCCSCWLMPLSHWSDVHRTMTRPRFNICSRREVARPPTAGCDNDSVFPQDNLEESWPVMQMLGRSAGRHLRESNPQPHDPWWLGNHQSLIGIHRSSIAMVVSLAYLKSLFLKETLKHLLLQYFAGVFEHTYGRSTIGQCFLYRFKDY